MTTEPEMDPAAGHSDDAPGAPADSTPAAEQATFDAEYVKTLRAENAKWRTEAKANGKAAKELEEFRKAQMTETERAIAEATARTRTEVLAELSSKIAEANIAAALAGIVPDPAAIIEDLNLSRYVTDSGDVDVKAVAALRDKYAALAMPRNPQVPSGPRGAETTRPSRDSLKNMTPDQIVAARRAGQLDHLLKG